MRFLFGSLALMGLYLFAIVAYLVALGPSAAAASDTIAAAAANRVLGPWAGKLVAFTILIATFSSANSVMLTSPRVFFAMASDNLFFKKLAEVHPRFGTPANAVVALGVWSAILASLGGFAKLATGAIFIGWIFYGLGCCEYFSRFDWRIAASQFLIACRVIPSHRCYLSARPSPSSATQFMQRSKIRMSLPICSSPSF